MRRVMIPTWKKVCLTIVLLLIVTTVSCFIVMCNFDSQLADYGRTAKYLSNFGYARAFEVSSLDYESLIKKYGVPTKEESKDILESTGNRIIHLEYPEFNMACVEFKEADGTMKKSLFLIVVKDDSIRFGRKSIRIGSTREEVHRAYAQEPPISTDELKNSAEDYPNVDEGFYGEDWSRILFCYDENGIVESMAYEPPAF